MCMGLAVLLGGPSPFGGRWRALCPTRWAGGVHLAAGHAVDAVVTKITVMFSPRLAADMVSARPMEARSPSPW